MVLSTNKWKSVFSSRLAKNVYFWLFTLLFIYKLNSGVDQYPQSVYLVYKGTLAALLIMLTYVNNLLLVPKLLARKKHWWYALAAILLLLIISTGFVTVFKHMLSQYPLAEIYQVSIITMPVGPSWTTEALTEEIVGYAFGLALWLGAFTMAWYMQDHSRQEKLAQQAAHKQTEAELELLRNQLNPHFLFNTLNNIYGLSLQHSDKAPESILKLSSIMRYMLYDTDVPFVSFENEKEIMQAYIDMELLRLQDTGNLKFNIDADDDYSLPPLLWLPILENTFKHGTRFIADQHYIDFSCTIHNHKLYITSANNYVPAKNEQGGVGLTNLRKRLDILYSGKYVLNSRQDNGVYKTELTVYL